MTKLPKDFILFGLVGVIGYMADVLVTSILAPAMGVYLSRIPAFLAAATTTWLINRRLTFAGRKAHHSNLLNEYMHYLLLMLTGLVINYLVYAISISYLRGSDYDILISVAFGSLAGMIINYITSRRYIYKAQ